jgi:hypothetical protein
MSKALPIGRSSPKLPDLELRASQTRLSIRKSCKFTAADFLLRRLIKARDLAEFDVFDPDPRHVERDKRTRKSPVESGILTLT